MWTNIHRDTRGKATIQAVRYLAREAFWGKNDALWEGLLWLAHSPTGLSLADAMQVAQDHAAQLVADGFLDNLPLPPTQDQVLAYMATAGVKCLFCASDDIEGGSLEIEGECAQQEVHCLACDRRWRDWYRLDGVTVDDCGFDSTDGDINESEEE